jgi:hypothetical protein
MADRDNRVSVSSYRDQYYDDSDRLSRQRSGRQYQYDDRRDHVQRYNEVSAPSTTRTTYRVSRPSRVPEARAGEGKVIVLDSRLDGDRELSEWEVIRPERSESGAYVIETSSTSDYGPPAGRTRGSTMGSDIEIISPPRPGRREKVAGRRERSLSRGTLDAMREVRVTEYSSDDDRRSAARPKVVPPALKRMPSSIRRDHSPESVTRRRSRSIGFVKEQISHHDASESRHERPGAEANVAGKYLINHRGETMNRRKAGDNEDDDTIISELPPLRKSRTDVIDTTERPRRRRSRREDDYRSSRDIIENDLYQDDRYPPQRSSRRYRSGRGRDGDDYQDEVYERRNKGSY